MSYLHHTTSHHHPLAHQPPSSWQLSRRVVKLVCISAQLLRVLESQVRIPRSKNITPSENVLPSPHNRPPPSSSTSASKLLATFTVCGIARLHKVLIVFPLHAPYRSPIVGILFAMSSSGTSTRGCRGCYRVSLASRPPSSRLAASSDIITTSEDLLHVPEELSLSHLAS